LPSRAGLEIQCDVAAFCGGSQYGSWFHAVTPVGKVQLSLIRESGAQLRAQGAPRAVRSLQRRVCARHGRELLEDHRLGIYLLRTGSRGTGMCPTLLDHTR
jgi:hypothetical protein